MANEVTPSSVGDLSTTQLQAEVILLAASRDNDILLHPAFKLIKGLPNGSVQKVSHVGLMGYDILTASTPGSEFANTALTDGSTSITLAGNSKRYNMDDLARFMVGDRVSYQMLAQDAMVSLMQTFISKAAIAGAGFSAVAGTSGSPLTWDIILSAKGTLAAANASGQPVCILHPRQWNDLEADAFANALTADKEVLSGSLLSGLNSYKGRWMGVDFFTSSHVPSANAGADRAGCMFVAGGLLVSYAAPLAIGAAPENIVDLAGYGIFEVNRRGNSGATDFITSTFVGAAIGVNAYGVSIITDL